MKLIKHISLFLLFIFLLACENDNNIPVNESSVQEEVNTFLENFGESIDARFIGTVVNEQGNPISGVTITIGSAFATTDTNGVFSITQATVYEKFAYVKASKEGFIDGSRALVPTDGINQVKIMLLELNQTATIASGQPLTVDLPGGTEVDFTGNFENEFGLVYQGNVSVTVKYLSPDDENMQLQMPGALLAENANGDLRVLETVGMIAVELRGESGEKLNIASGEMATIRIPVANSVTNPPATIPLWSFNETFGYWEEDGIGTLDGSRFIAEVSHFSFWNWDFQYPSAKVCITLQDTNGNVLPYTALDLFSPALNSTGMYGYTNGNGEACGLVPQDDILTLIVPDYGCLDNDFTTTIGPFTSDESVTITVTDPNALTTNFIATLNDCDGNAMTNGYLQLFFNDSTQTYPINNGMLDLVIDYCTTSTGYTAQVIDLDNSQSTTVFNGNFTIPITDLGMQMSCVDLTDTDGDGVLDIDEDLNGNNNLDDDDTDGDGIANYMDLDDDGDGVNTIDEDSNNDGDPTNDDIDGDGIANYLDENDINLLASEIWATNCDVNNLEYDLTVNYENSGNYPNLMFSYYETETDAVNNTNAIANPSMYVSLNTTMVFVRGTDTMTGQSFVVDIILLGAGTDIDSDQDGLTDCEELTGIDDGVIIFGPHNCNPNGNITDPNDADSDDDGFDDCVESLVGSDPNDVTSIPTIPNIIVNDVSVNEDQSVVVEFILTSPAIDEITIDFQFNDITTNPSDYVITLPIFYNIQIAETGGNFAFPISLDAINEGSETLEIVPVIVSGTINSVSSGIITIMD